MPINYKILNFINSHGWIADLAKAFRQATMFEFRQPRQAAGFMGKTLMLTSTQQCQARCVFCPHRKITARRDTMTIGTARKAMEEWKKVGGTGITFSCLTGDALLDPNLGEKLALANRMGFGYTHITTNGIALLTRENYKMLVDNGISHIELSLEGMDPVQYKKVYGVDRHAQVLEGIVALLNEIERQNSPTCVTLYFLNSTRPSKVINTRYYQTVIRPRLGPSLKVYFTCWFDSWCETVKQSELVGTMKLQRRFKTHTTPCAHLSDYSVTVDGRIRLCGCRMKWNDHDGLVVGNIQEGFGPAMEAAKTVWGMCPSVCHSCWQYMPSRLQE